MKAVQVIIIPAHGDLDNVVEISNGRTTKDSKATPDHGAYPTQGDFDGVEFHDVDTSRYENLSISHYSMTK